MARLFLFIQDNKDGVLIWIWYYCFSSAIAREVSRFGSQPCQT